MDTSLALVLLAAALFIAYMIFRINRAKRIAIDYFQNNGVEVQKIGFRLRIQVLQGLFSSPNHVFFYTILSNPDGEKRAAHIRVGDWFVGLLKPEIKIFWLNN